MTRKEAKAILEGLDISNRFSLKSVGFLGWDTMQVLTVKDWTPTANLTRAVVEEAFKGRRVIVEFDGPGVLFS